MESNILHEEEACVVFAEVVQRMMDRANALPDLLVSAPQLLAINFIYHHPGASVGDLAKGLNTSSPAATQIADRMVKKGWLTRKEHEKDRRLASLNLTDASLDILQRARQEKRRPLEEILESLPEEARQSLFKGLSSFIFKALKDEGSADRICDHCWMEHFGDCLINQVHVKLTGKEVERSTAKVKSQA